MAFLVKNHHRDAANGKVTLVTEYPILLKYPIFDMTRTCFRFCNIWVNHKIFNNISFICICQLMT